MLIRELDEQDSDIENGGEYALANMYKGLESKSNEPVNSLVNLSDDDILLGNLSKYKLSRMELNFVTWL